MINTGHVFQQVAITAVCLLLAVLMAGLGLTVAEHWVWYALVAGVWMALMLAHNLRYHHLAEVDNEQRNFLLDTVSSASPVIVWEVNAQGVVVDVCGRALEEAGWSRENLLGRTIANIVDQDPEILEDVRRAQSGDRFVSFKAFNGRFFRHHYYPIYDRMGRVSGYNCVSVDMSREHDLGAELQLSQQVFAHTADAIVLTDHYRHIVSVNQAFTDITGFEPEEVKGKKLGLPNPEQPTLSLYRQLASSLNLNGSWEGEIRALRKTGDAYTANFTMSVIRKNGRITNFVAFFSDVTDIKKSQEELQYLANHDNLTGLPNRRLFLDRLDQAVKRARRLKYRLAILFIDLDNFKTINDTLGHAFGDQLLKDVSARLLAAVRETDTVARLAGDEFTVIAENVRDSTEVIAIARKILSCFAPAFAFEDKETEASASVGISIYPDDGDDIAELMSGADTAMYRAKAEGRNGYYFLSGEASQSSQGVLFFPSELRLALRRNQMQLLYQPQVDLDTGAIVGCEALLRWNHHCRGQLMPADFLPMAEEKDLISDLGSWVAEEVCNQLRIWQNRGTSIQYAAINLAADQLADRDFIGNLQIAIDNNRLAPETLILEIPEHIALENLVETHEFMHQARAIGVATCIDEFGSAGDGFSYLKELPVTMVKIDQKLLSQIKPGKEVPGFLRALVGIADLLDLKVVAVGVERASQEEVLQQIGFQYGQGYLYAKPMTAESFSRFALASRNLPAEDWQAS